MIELCHNFIQDQQSEPLFAKRDCIMSKHRVLEKKKSFIQSRDAGIN